MRSAVVVLPALPLLMRDAERYARRAAERDIEYYAALRCAP